LKQIGEAIVQDHDERISAGLGVNMKPLEKLEKKTINRKKAAGYEQPATPLFATGTMKKLILKSPKRNKVEVRVSALRDKIGNWHQTGKANNKLRKWFGISDRVAAFIAGAITQEIQRKINIATDKGVG
tara:strand:- start:19975 stop:20361 length:387 start_codon:yes stop_codon:yes gene_type:complete